MNFTKSSLFQKFEWFTILILHLALLYWIFYILKNSGYWDTDKIFIHFSAISIYGALLIRFCAWLYMRKYKIEKRDHGAS